MVPLPRVPALTFRAAFPIFVVSPVSVAVMLVTPVAIELAIPVDAMVATAVFEEAQVTLFDQLAVEVFVPSVNVPDAENASVLLTAMVGPIGEIVTPVSCRRSNAALPVLVVSAVDVAVTVIGPGAVTGFGAV